MLKHIKRHVFEFRRTSRRNHEPRAGRSQRTEIEKAINVMKKSFKPKTTSSQTLLNKLKTRLTQMPLIQTVLKRHPKKSYWILKTMIRYQIPEDGDIEPSEEDDEVEEELENVDEAEEVGSTDEDSVEDADTEVEDDGSGEGF